MNSLDGLIKGAAASSLPTVSAEPKTAYADVPGPDGQMVRLIGAVVGLLPTPVLEAIAEAVADRVLQKLASFQDQLNKAKTEVEKISDAAAEADSVHKDQIPLI